jgi:hypothetical protein
METANKRVLHKASESMSWGYQFDLFLLPITRKTKAEKGHRGKGGFDSHHSY